MLIFKNNQLHCLMYLNSPDRIWYPVPINCDFSADFIENTFATGYPDDISILQHEFRLMTSSDITKLYRPQVHDLLTTDGKIRFYAMPCGKYSMLVFLEKRHGICCKCYVWDYIYDWDKPETLGDSCFCGNVELGSILRQKIAQVMGWEKMHLHTR